MLNSIPCGDLELNISHPHGMPTLVPSPALEQRMDWRLQQAPDAVASSEQTGAETDASPLPPLAVHLHVHYIETLPTLLGALSSCRSGLQGLRLWISTDTSAKANAISATIQQNMLAEQATTTKVRVCPNRGRNLGPLLQRLWPELKQEALLLHLHGKRSLETDLGTAWLDQLLQRLLPDGDTVLALRQQFHNDPTLGLVMPQPPALIRPYLNWGNNFELARQLAKPMGQDLHPDAVLVFPAGGMFWVRPAALAPLTECVVALAELPPEPVPVDGSSLHAMERLVAHACEASGHHWRLACPSPGAASSDMGSISVLESRPNDFQQATSLLASRCRHIEEQLLCSATNLERCNAQLNQQIETADKQLREADQQFREAMKQLSEADKQLREADQQLREADTTIRDLNHQIMVMASSWGWKFTCLLKKLLRSGT